MSYLTEAFTRLDLVEDAFAADDAGMEELKDFMDSDTADDTISVIDVDAETPEDVKESYDGKIVLECPVCKSKLFKNEDDVVIDEELELANVEDECPYCYTVGGFNVLGKIVPYTTTEVTVKDKDEDSDADDDKEDKKTEEDDDTVTDDLKREKDDDEEELTESFDNLHIDLDNTEIDVKEKTPAPDAEMIAPLDMEEKAEIDANEPEVEEPVEDNTIDFDIDEIDDNADNMVESYLKEAYDNVASYKTDKAVMGKDKFMLEGTVTFDDGTTDTTTFTFRPLSGTRNGKVKFMGENLSVVPKKNAYLFEGRVRNKKLMCETLSYKYSVLNEDTQKNEKVAGTITARGGKRK